MFFSGVKHYSLIKFVLWSAELKLLEFLERSVRFTIPYLNLYNTNFDIMQYFIMTNYYNISWLIISQIISYLATIITWTNIVYNIPCYIFYSIYNILKICFLTIEYLHNCYSNTHIIIAVLEANFCPQKWHCTRDCFFERR